MKTITLTFNEALVLIAEGMTMNNVKSLANKLRNADAPVNPQFTQYDNEVVKQNLKLANSRVYDLERALEKAKQTETTLRDENRELTERTNCIESKLRDLENDARQDDESLKYFRKWVEELRVVLDCDKGLTTAAVFSQAVEHIKEHNQTVKALNKGTRHLTKANATIARVKTVYDQSDCNIQPRAVLSEIKEVVEAYYRGN